MRFITRWAFRSLILLIVLVVCLVLLKDTLAKSFVEHRIRIETGMDVRIGKLEVGLFTPMINVQDLKLYNLPEYGGLPFLDMPDLHLEYDLRALFMRRVHFRLVRLYLAELNVVEGRNGHTNVNLSLDALTETAPRSASVNFGSGFEFAGIDTLNFTLGKVRYTSLRQAGKETEVKLGLRNRVVTNIKTLHELTNVLIKTLFQNGITVITNPPPRR